MTNTKVIQLLANLSQKEIKDFAKYIHSPYFNTHQDTARFFDIIYKYYPNFKDEKLEVKRIFIKMYPGKNFKEQKIRILRKYLYKHLLNFLGQQQLEANKLGYEIKKLEALLIRKDLKFFDDQAKKLAKNIEGNIQQNSQFFLDTYLFENLKIYYSSTHQSRWESKGFKEIKKALNYYYMAEKIRLFCSELNENRILAREAQNGWIINTVLAYCEENYKDLPFIIQIYYLMARLGQDPDNNSICFRIKTELPRIHELFNRQDQINVCNYLINIYYQQYQKGKLHYGQKMFLLYKNMLEHDLLFEEALLSSNHYKNIVTLGLRLGNFEWTKNFIETYQSYIDPKYRESVFNYNMAQWHYYNEQYSESLKHLQNVNFIEPFYKISHDLLLLKIYYERRDNEAFMALCLNFQNFIRRKKELNGHQRQAYLNFIQSTRALFLVKILQRHDLHKAIERIEQSNIIIEKEWLLKKLEKLKKEKNMSHPAKFRDDSC